jgi:hypothetical protein
MPPTKSWWHDGKNYEIQGKKKLGFQVPPMVASQFRLRQALREYDLHHLISPILVPQMQII